MSDSLREARPRVAEIRQENWQGDVSARDIEWLCDVAVAATALAESSFGQLHARDFYRLREALDGR